MAHLSLVRLVLALSWYLSTPLRTPLLRLRRARARRGALRAAGRLPQEPIRAATGGAARARRRALGRVYGRVGIPVGVVFYVRRTEALSRSDRPDTRVPHTGSSAKSVLHFYYARAPR